MLNKEKMSTHAMKCRGTLCWRCAKNTGFCTWSESLTPVKGWQAIKQVIKNANGELMDSYHVMYCPQFEKGNV